VLLVLPASDLNDNDPSPRQLDDIGRYPLSELIVPRPLRRIGRTILNTATCRIKDLRSINGRENKWCPEEDSNLHASRRQYLKLAAHGTSQNFAERNKLKSLTL